jgi:RIO kinase 1
VDADRFFQELDKEGIKSEKQRSHSRKIREAVFDRLTLITIQNLEKKGLFKQLKSVVSEGKEAKLFHATSDSGDVAVKIYLVETSDFRKMGKYVKGDPRFGDWGNKRQLITLWAQKEYKNLMRAYDMIKCPRPLGFQKNILVMEFLGEDGISAPKLKDAELDDPQEYYHKVGKAMRELYKLRIVHSDLSEYNILDYRGEPYFIDFSAGVLLDHPHAMEFLERDIRNIVGFFSKKGVETDFESLKREVTDGI